MNLEIGMKVVCIDDTFGEWARLIYTQLPIKDQIYVIRDIRLGTSLDDGKWVGNVSVLLIGIVNPFAKSRARLEYGFSEHRFVKTTDHRVVSIPEEVLV